MASTGAEIPLRHDYQLAGDTPTFAGGLSVTIGVLESGPVWDTLRDVPRFRALFEK